MTLLSPFFDVNCNGKRVIRQGELVAYSQLQVGGDTSDKLCDRMTFDIKYTTTTFANNTKKASLGNIIRIVWTCAIIKEQCVNSAAWSSSKIKDNDTHGNIRIMSNSSQRERYSYHIDRHESCNVFPVWRGQHCISLSGSNYDQHACTPKTIMVLRLVMTARIHAVNLVKHPYFRDVYFSNYVVVHDIPSLYGYDTLLTCYKCFSICHSPYLTLIYDTVLFTKYAICFQEHDMCFRSLLTMSINDKTTMRSTWKG